MPFGTFGLAGFQSGGVYSFDGSGRAVRISSGVCAGYSSRIKRLIRVNR